MTGGNTLGESKVVRFKIRRFYSGDVDEVEHKVMARGRKVKGASVKVRVNIW